MIRSLQGWQPPSGEWILRPFGRRRDPRGRTRTWSGASARSEREVPGSCDRDERGGTAGLLDYVTYYTRSRTHLALGKDTPCPRPVAPPSTGRIVAIPEVGGLHHRTTSLWLRDGVQIAVAAQVELVVHQCGRGVEPIVQRIARQHFEARPVADDERRPVAAGDVDPSSRCDG